MLAPVFLNGRFLGQATTGVQRFSAEIMAAIDGMVAKGEWPKTVVLMPRRSRAEPGCGTVAACARLPLRQVGRMQGHCGNRPSCRRRLAAACSSASETPRRCWQGAGRSW